LGLIIKIVPSSGYLLPVNMSVKEMTVLQG